MGGRVNRMEVVIVRKVTKENSAKKVVPLEFFQVVKTIISTGIFFRIINEKSNQKEKLFLLTLREILIFSNLQPAM